jgi:SAM-dependent methyltransferase
MKYGGLEKAHSTDVPHLGGSIRLGDPFTYCPTVWDYVIARFGIESVLDFGSGYGNASHYFHRKGLKVVAVEGFAPSVDRSIYPAIRHDLTNGPVHTKVDLVHCQEVVEHIEERFLDNLLDTMLTGKIILITHAVPGQGGHHHVNLQPSAYWIDHLRQRNCSYLEEDTRRVREFAIRDGAQFMAATGMLFANRARA